LRAQRLAGEVQEGESNGAMIGNKIMSGAMNFIRAQTMAIVSSRNVRGRRWASLLVGKEGFLTPSADRRTLTISLDPAELDATDPLWEDLRADSHIGVLIIELISRRRLRVNGEAVVANGALTVTVQESYGNCPKYITRREVHIEPQQKSTSQAKVSRGTKLTPSQIDHLAISDVLFLATGHPRRDADASHRGGTPGFVEVLDASTLRMPDYSGNSMFNTLGNLLVDPHYGMLVPDFRSGKMLQITGTATISWSDADQRHRTGGTHRFVEFHVEEWREATLPVHFIENILDYSPYNP
jgi:predicted pyridoxine 5'-phosphate oxidase superfamily flavin-nucleotide-binding protein